MKPGQMKNAAVLTLLLLSLVACKKAADTTSTDTNTRHHQDRSGCLQAPSPLSRPLSASRVLFPAGYTLLAPVSSKPVYKFASEPARTLKDGTDYYALIDTSKGQILADLYEAKTPVTVNNFVTLARNHFYDGILFHRVLDGFMAQTATRTPSRVQRRPGQGGPGYAFADELRRA